MTPKGGKESSVTLLDLLPSAALSLVLAVGLLRNPLVLGFAWVWVVPMLLAPAVVFLLDREAAATADRGSRKVSRQDRHALPLAMTAPLRVPNASPPIARRRASLVATADRVRPRPATVKVSRVQPREVDATRIVRRRGHEQLAFVVEHTGAGAIHRLGERTLIGRSGNPCDIVIDDDMVSRKHASIRCQDGRFVVRDLDSSNGTWLLDGGKEARIEAPHVLSEHDRIRVGSTVLVFTSIDDGARGEHREIWAEGRLLSDATTAPYLLDATSYAVRSAVIR